MPLISSKIRMLIMEELSRSLSMTVREAITFSLFLRALILNSFSSTCSQLTCISWSKMLTFDTCSVDCLMFWVVQLRVYIFCRVSFALLFLSNTSSVFLSWRYLEQAWLRSTFQTNPIRLMSSPTQTKTTKTMSREIKFTTLLPAAPAKPVAAIPTYKIDNANSLRILIALKLSFLVTIIPNKQPRVAPNSKPVRMVGFWTLTKSANTMGKKTVKRGRWVGVMWLLWRGDSSCSFEGERSQQLMLISLEALFYMASSPSSVLGSSCSRSSSLEYFLDLESSKLAIILISYFLLFSPFSWGLVMQVKSGITFLPTTVSAAFLQQYTPQQMIQMRLNRLRVQLQEDWQEVQWLQKKVVNDVSMRSQAKANRKPVLQQGQAFQVQASSVYRLATMPTRHTTRASTWTIEEEKKLERQSKKQKLVVVSGRVYPKGQMKG